MLNAVLGYQRDSKQIFDHWRPNWENCITASHCSQSSSCQISFGHTIPHLIKVHRTSPTFPHLAMGSVSSTHKPIIIRKRSAVFARITLPCTSGTSLDSTSEHFPDTYSLVNEKSRYKDREEPPAEQPHPPSFAAYAPTQDNIPDGAITAYQDFLNKFPGAHPLFI